MEHRPFGQTGLDVSAVGFGCWEIGGGYGSIEAEEFPRAVGRALDLGINCFDTAEGYGMGAPPRAPRQGLRPGRGGAGVLPKLWVDERGMTSLATDQTRARGPQPPREPKTHEHPGVPSI